MEDEGVAGMEEIRKTLTLNVSFLKLKDWAEHFGTIAEYDVKSILDGPGKGFDLVIFDTSPMAAKNRNNIDPIAVARRCDASLLLVSPRTSSRSQLVNLRERIRREKLDLLGLMVNEGVLA